MKASVTLLIRTLLVMRSRIRSEATESLRYLMVAYVQVPVKKSKNVNSVPIFNLMVICSLVYTCVCIEVWPTHTTNAEPIAPLVTSVEAPTYVLHPPLPASKAFLSSWSLVVICLLIASGVTGITGWYDNRLVVPEVPLYKFENIGYLQGTRAPPVCLRMYGYSYLHTWHQVLLLLLLWRKCWK